MARISISQVRKSQFQKATAIFGAALLSAGLAGCGGDSSETGGNDLGLVQPGVLTLTAVRSQVPMSSVGEDGEPAGFAVDLADEIAERLDLETEYTVDDVAPALSGVQNGKYDLMVAATVETAERKEVHGFSLGWYWAPSIFLSTSGVEYAAVDELSGKTVGVVEATAQEAALTNQFPDIEPKIFADQNSAVNALKGNQVDAVFLGGVNALQLVEDDSSLVLGPEVKAEAPSGFVLPKDNDALKEAVDGAIVDIIEDGTFLEMWNDNVSFPPSDQAIAKFPELAG